MMVCASVTTMADMVLQPRHITTAQGLTSNYVNAILQDQYGFIWIGSTGGLSVYDGYFVRHFTNIPYGNEGRTMTPGVNGLVNDTVNGLMWIKTANFVFFCHDVRSGRFVDYTGRGDQTRTFREMVLGKNGTAWLYQDVNGVRRVQYDGKTFHVIDYTLENKTLPWAEVRMVTLIPDGGAWFSTDNGIVYVDAAGKSSIKGKGFKVRRCVEADGHYLFFTSGNEVLVYNAKGEMERTIPIPASIGTIHRVTGDVADGHRAQVFTNNGTLCVDLERMTLERSSWPDMTEGVYFGTFGQYHVIITRHGELFIVNTQGEPVIRRQILRPEEVTSSFMHDFSVTADAFGTIYITTNGQGLYIFYPTEEALSHFQTTDANPILNTDNLHYVATDREGNLWVGTQGAGITCLTPNSRAQGRYLHPAPNDKRSASNRVRGIFPLEDGRLLITTENHCNYAFNQQTDTFEPFTSFDGTVYSYLTDSYGHHWVGTAGRGFYIDGQHYQKNEDVYRVEFVSCDYLEEDQHQRIWIGARNYGLKMLPAAKEYGGNLKFKSFLDRNAGERTINDMAMDSMGRLWIATCGGLFMVDTRQKDITAESFHSYLPANSPLPSYDIMSLCVNGDKVWCGIRGGGVVRCTFNDDASQLVECTQLTNAQGLAGNNVNQLQTDQQGNIWAGTENGLSLINTRTLSVRILKYSQQIDDNYFVTSASCLLPDGRLLLGTGGGLLEIAMNGHDDHQKVRPITVGVRVTDLFVDNQSIFTNLADSINCLTYIRDHSVQLEYDRNNIEVFFSTLHFANTDATAYQYWLEGRDRSWKSITSESHASYMQLKPDKYTFHVKALVNNVWTEEYTFTIRILPPWWRTWWAYLIYICACAIIGVMIYRQLRTVYLLRKHVKEERRQRQMQQELIDYKVRFFTNISHEFRTPLTIIRGMVERLKQLNQQGNMKQPLDTLQRSSDRMMRLINQLLEFRKMQEGKLHLALREADIVAHIQNIYMDFHEAAEEKGLRYDFRMQMKSLFIPFDSTYIDKIMYNLIANAFKYTPRKGEVVVNISVRQQEEQKNLLVISVEDSGVGVPEDLRQHLFDRYMESSRVVKDSLGIGLTLTGELVRTHHGTIEYTEREGGGSIFTITLPTSRDAYSNDDFMDDSTLSNEEEEAARQGFEQTYREMKANPLNEDVTVLVVEDDGDVAAYIEQTLAPYFNVVTAGNGEEALNMLTEQCQLVISDVMMPQMDGFELTARIRKSEQWNHLPIILLTALTDQDKYIRGISRGANLYLSKPFSPSVLVAHALQLVSQHQRVQTSVVAAAQGEIPQVVVSDIRDKNFLHQVDDIISRHLSDENLSVETITDGLNIGRSKFFEKMKALMDMTPRDYILKRRMDYAVELLKEGKLGIAEIAYKTGFGHPPYFTRVFKKYFGVTPSEFIKRGER